MAVQFSDKFDLSPHPRALQSLRSTGINNWEACHDIIDNSLDANAQNVWVILEGEEGEEGGVKPKRGRPPHPKLVSIGFADDGDGMDAESLSQALRLGSDLGYQPGCMGKFGMGLKTSANSMGRRITVFSKAVGCEVLKMEYDLDRAQNATDFCFGKFGKATAEEEQAFLECINNSKSGTVVKIDKLDHLECERVPQFEEKLFTEIGRTFRFFIKAGRCFSLNGKVIPFSDPLKLNDKNTQVHDEFVIKIKSFYMDEIVEGNIGVKVVYLTQERDGKEEALGAKAAGFYIVRGNREIAHADGLWYMHSRYHLTRFRCELTFSPDLDDVLGVNIHKKSISPIQSVRDQMDKELKKVVTEARALHDRGLGNNKEGDKELNKIHKSSARHIASKAALLTLPEGVREKRKSAKRTKSGKKAITDTGRNRQPDQERSQKGAADIAEFKHVHYGDTGSIFEPDLDRRITQILINVDHPFYKRFYKESKESIVRATDYLLHAWAAIEVEMHETDDNADAILKSLRAKISNNVRELLG